MDKSDALEFVNHSPSVPDKEDPPFGIMILMSSIETWNRCQENLGGVLSRIDRKGEKPIIHMSVTEEIDIYGYTPEYLIVDKRIRANKQLLHQCMDISESLEELIFI